VAAKQRKRCSLFAQHTAGRRNFVPGEGFTPTAGIQVIV